MKLYHFTNRECARRIAQEGITHGGVYLPYSAGSRVFRGFLWLTDDPRFEAQHWATNLSGKCGDRTQVRLTIELPEGTKIKPWNTIARTLFLLSPTDLCAFNLAGHSDGSHWYLYRGVIPASWIIEKTERTKEYVHGKS